MGDADSVLTLIVISVVIFYHVGFLMLITFLFLTFIPFYYRCVVKKIINSLRGKTKTVTTTENDT